jgi:spore germination protein
LALSYWMAAVRDPVRFNYPVMVSREARQEESVAPVRFVALLVAAVLAAGCNSEARPPGTPAASGSSPGPESTASASAVASASPVAPSPTPAEPLTPFGYRAKGMTHEVIAFVNHGHLDDVVPRLNYDAVSTIAYFSLSVTGSGRIDRSRSDWRRWVGPSMDTLIARAHAAGTKVVPSIKRFAWTSSEAAETRKLLSNPVARQRAAREIAQLVHDRGVDGVNIDVEPVPRGQSTNFVRFVREVRRALNAKRPGYQLTFCATGHITNYDVKGATRPGGADAVYIMGYQYRGRFSQIAGSVAPLGGPHYDYRETVRSFLRQTTAQRIILGVPLFGWSWETETAGVRSRITGGSRALFYRQAVIEAARRPFRYDRTEEVAWTAFRTGSRWRQMYFDNLRALEAKWNFIIRSKLRGTGLWALGFEGNRTSEILGLLRKTFVRTPN